MKILATEKSIREFVKESMSGTGVGWQHSVDVSEKPIGANAVVDPMAAATDPANEKFKPRNPTELKIALSTLVNDLGDVNIPDTFDAIKDAVDDVKTSNEEEEANMKKNENRHVEEAVRKSIKNIIKEIRGGSTLVNESTAWEVRYEGPDDTKKGSAASLKKNYVLKFGSQQLAQKYIDTLRGNPSIKNVVGPTEVDVAEDVKPAVGVTEVPVGQVGQSVLDRREKNIASLRGKLEKWDESEKVVKPASPASLSGHEKETALLGDKGLEDMVHSDPGIEAVATAVRDAVPNDDALNFAEAFNMSKERILQFETSAELGQPEEGEEESDVLDDFGGGESTEGDVFVMGDEQLSKKDVASLSKDYALYSTHGDVAILKTDTFKKFCKELWGDGFNFDEFAVQLGVEVRKAIATNLSSGKRGYLKDKLMTLEEIATMLGVSIALTNKDAHRALGKYALGVKAATLGEELDIED